VWRGVAWSDVGKNGQFVEQRAETESAWHQKLTEICIQLTWHSPSPTPLLPALTLSAGEYRVSGGELKMSRQVGLPRNPRARRPKPKNSLPLFLAASSKLLSYRYSRATDVLLLFRVHGPCRSLRSSHLS
jgi:hypothetical protein